MKPMPHWTVALMTAAIFFNVLCILIVSVAYVVVNPTLISGIYAALSIVFSMFLALIWTKLSWILSKNLGWLSND